MPATKTLRREFLQLADTYNPLKNKVAGFYVSEKLDGTRCFWDGGLTRGMRTEDVPWASVLDPKKGTRKEKIKPVATGLWSRYGNPIIAPEWFLNALPACPLDGELWAGRGKFQLCRSICGGDTPDPRFDQISYAVYSSPALPHILATGEIKNANMLCNVDLDVMQKFVMGRLEDFDGDFRFVDPGSTFEQELLFLRENIEPQGDRCFLHRQIKLAAKEEEARLYIETMLEDLLADGAEGVVIRDPSSVWTPKRHKGLLKFKPYEDAEAEIIGFVAGKEGKKGQVLGKIGALVCAFDNIEFEIGSGLTMDQREFTPRGSLGAAQWAEKNPGERLPAEFNKSKHFRVGETITFKYRELSDDGIPKEGRFWRKRDVE